MLSDPRLDDLSALRVDHLKEMAGILPDADEDFSVQTRRSQGDRHLGSVGVIDTPLLGLAETARGHRLHLHAGQAEGWVKRFQIRDAVHMGRHPDGGRSRVEREAPAWLGRLGPDPHLEKARLGFGDGHTGLFVRERYLEMKPALLHAPLSWQHAAELGPDEVVDQVSELEDEPSARRQGLWREGPRPEHISRLPRAAPQARAADRIATAIALARQVQIIQYPVNQHGFSPLLPVFLSNPEQKRIDSLKVGFMF